MVPYGFRCKTCKESFTLFRPRSSSTAPAECPRCGSRRTRRLYQFGVKVGTTAAPPQEEQAKAQEEAAAPLPKFYDPAYTGRRFENITVANAAETGLTVRGLPFVGKDIRLHNNPVGLDATDADVDVVNLEID